MKFGNSVTGFNLIEPESESEATSEFFHVTVLLRTVIKGSALLSNCVAEKLKNNAFRLKFETENV